MLVTHGCSDPTRHADATLFAAAQRLAALLGVEFAGPFEQYRGGRASGTAGVGRLYHLPRATLSGLERVTTLGLRGESDLFGGWVPFDFMATKAIVHPLVAGAAHMPEGWPAGLAESVAGSTLRGFTAFSPGDAETAGRELLGGGAVRLKAVHADGGREQVVARSPAELDDAVALFRAGDGLRDALVLEENLTDVTTYSIGQVRVGGTVASYCGTQSLTQSNSGATVYGGSALLVVRGGYAALLSRPLTRDMRRAVACARRFDRRVATRIPGLFASRRNYDVAIGRDAGGTHRVGLLEQSWRAGGATGAELAALEVFMAEPRVVAVRTRTVERYGIQPAPPPGATVYFHGHDPAAGPLTKYAIVEERYLA